jgi:hypothetical protein
MRKSLYKTEKIRTIILWLLSIDNKMKRQYNKNINNYSKYS